MICDDAELEEITKRTRPSAQAKVLRFMGIMHLVRPDGSIAVSLSHVEHLLNGSKGTKVKVHEPNWGALKR
jgi:hypothetical protein